MSNLIFISFSSFDCLQDDGTFPLYEKKNKKEIKNFTAIIKAVIKIDSTFCCQPLHHYECNYLERRRSNVHGTCDRQKDNDNLEIKVKKTHKNSHCFNCMQSE